MCGLHLAVFMKLEFAASLGLSEFCPSLWRDRTAVPCLQDEAAAAVHAGFCMKALEGTSKNKRFPELLRT